MNKKIRFHRSYRFFSLIGFILGLLMMTAVPVLASVTLVSFTATAGNNQVLVAWQTANESDNAGFFIYRSIHQSSGFVAISPLIYPTSSGSTGGQYSFLDTNVSNGITYFYELAAVNTNNETEFFPPVGPIVPGVAAFTATGTLVVSVTPTPTGPTSTRTVTPPATPTPPGTPTITPNPTFPSPVQNPSPVPLQTPYPGPIAITPAGVTQTPGAFATSEAQLTQEGGPTSTLRPFPSITVEFYYSSPTPRVSIQPTSGPGDNGLSGWVNIARLGPLALILLVWVLLGGWFYLTLRRMD
jgi:hypothetical protein